MIICDDDNNVIIIITITISDYIFIVTTYHLIPEQWFMSNLFAF